MLKTFETAILVQKDPIWPEKAPTWPMPKIKFNVFFTEIIRRDQKLSITFYFIICFDIIRVMIF